MERTGDSRTHEGGVVATHEMTQSAARFTRGQFLGYAAACAAAGAVSSRLWAAQPADAQVAGGPFGPFLNDPDSVIDITAAPYNAKRDTVRAVGGGAIAAGSTTFTQAGYTFTSNDTSKVVTVQGAGLDGAVLTSRIVAVVTGSTVTLAHPALTTVSDAGFSYGTDDTPAIVQASIDAGIRKTLFAPAGVYTIRGSSENLGKQIRLKSRGGLVGEGGKYDVTDPSSLGATVFLCADANAGILPVGNARYEGFMCDGNNLATSPMLNGAPTGETVGSGGTDATVPTGGLPTSPTGTMVGGGSVVVYATFVDVWSVRSAGSGWSIFATQNNTYYECGTADNAVDGLYMDAGAGGLDFFNFYERGSLQYGVHADFLIPNTIGYKIRVADIAFYGGTFDSHPQRRGTSRAYLRSPYNWDLLGVTFVGDNLSGPTVNLVQTHNQSYNIVLDGCSISATATGTAPGRACVLISGIPFQNTPTRFASIRRCTFASGDTSVHIENNNRYFWYSAQDWVADNTLFGPFTIASADNAMSIANATIPDGDALMRGRTGRWRDLALAAPWTGTVQYRITSTGDVELQGSAQTPVAASGKVFVLPLGYRPMHGATARVLRIPTTDAMATPGVAQLTVTSGAGTTATGGTASVAALAGGGAVPAGTTLLFGGMRLPTSVDQNAPNPSW